MGSRLLAAEGQVLFEKGTAAYVSGQFETAAECLRQSAEAAPSSGAWHNLGNAEWQCQRTGSAILAWERAFWLDPFNANTRANLRFARKAAQLEGPNLGWHEICSTWLPPNTWALIGAASFWLAVAMIILPGVFRWRRADWHQGLAAGGFAIFILILPALIGLHHRSQIGVIVTKDTSLRLTPTQEAQVLGKLPAGTMVRHERRRGDYTYVRTASDAAGWIRNLDFGLICASLED